MKFLIAGLGSIGMRHLAVLRKLGGNEFYCIRSGKGRNTTPEGVTEIGSMREASDIGIDAALITNPTSMHVSSAAEAAANGMDLFIEKPLGKDFEGIAELQRACNDNGTKVLMGYNFLHHPAIRFMKELVEDGRAGKIISARAQFGTYMPGWHKDEDHKQSYAALRDLGGGVVLTSIHEQNYLTDLFGSVSEVKAMETSGNVTGIECEEGIEILMKHDSGVLSSVHLNFFQKPYYRNCQIIGTKGTITWNFLEPVVNLMQSEHSETWKMGKGAFELLDESYERQMTHFIEVVKGEEPPVCGLEDGIRDLKVALQILKETGRS